MKRIILSYLTSLFLLLGIGNNVFGQAVGDYGSMAASGTPGTMNWFTGTWYVCTTIGTWTGATTTTTPPTNAKNVWILAGDSVVISNATTLTANCLNLEIAGKLNQVGTTVELSRCYGNLHVSSTGVFYARQKYIWGNNSSTTSISLTVDTGGKLLMYDQLRLMGSTGSATSTLTNNGIMGAATAVANGSATIYLYGLNNSNITFTGIGTSIFRAINSDTNAGTFSVTIDQDMTFCPATGSAGIKLQNSSGVGASTTRSFTINTGKTVTLFSGWFANTAAYANIDANNTYNINGTLDASAASTYLGCTTNTTVGQQGATNSQIINIGSTGVLKLGSVVNVNKPQSGQTLAVNVSAGGTITYAGTAYQTFPTASTFAVTATPYALLTNSNSNLSFTNTSSAVTMNSDLTVGGNLVLSASGTWSGTGKTIMTGTAKTISAGTLGNLEVATGAAENIITTSGTLIANGDITVTSGTLKMGASLSAYNISIANGAVLTSNNGANSGSRRTLTVGAGAAGNDATVTVNGTLGGTKWSADGIDIEVSANAKTFSLNGTGIIAISGIRPAVNANSRALDIYLNTSLYLSRDNGGAANIEPALTLQNGTCTFNRTLTVANGVTLTFQGNAGLHGKRNDPTSADELLNNYASSSSNQGNCTYNVNGIMDLRSYSTGAICNLNTTSFAGNTQSVTVNVGSTGVLKLGRVVKLYTALTGQTVSIVPAAGSTVEYGGTTAATILLTTGTGTLPTLPTEYSNLTISNTNGITLSTDFSVSGIMTVNQSLTGGTITLLPGANATVASGKVLTASILNLNSNSSGTATLLNNGTVTITTANVEQYLPDARNWYVSSPVSKAIAPNGFSYYSYDETGQNPSPVAPATAYWVSLASGADLNKGVGYIALPSTSGSTIMFSTKPGETLNSGNVDVILTRSGATKTGFNLIGNPYPCHMGWTYDFVTANSSLIEPSIWVRTNAGTTNNSGQWSFATFNATSAESVPSLVNAGVIAPMQAFWVRAKAAGTLTLNSNLTKSHQASNPLKNRSAINSERQRIRLEVSNAVSTDEALVFVDAAAQNDYDGYDSPKMSNNSTSMPEIYTVANGQKLVINGLNAIENDMEIPMGFTTNQANTFTLRATQLSNISADTKVYLKDNMQVNSLIELSEGQDYIFTSDVTTDNTSRFSLVFKAPSITTKSNLTKQQLVRVFSNANNQIVVERNLIANDAVANIYNSVGQLVQQLKLSNTVTTSDISYPCGTYFVTVTEINKITTSKVIVNNI